MCGLLSGLTTCFDRCLKTFFDMESKNLEV